MSAFGESLPSFLNHPEIDHQIGVIVRSASGKQLWHCCGWHRIIRFKCNSYNHLFIVIALPCQPLIWPICSSTVNCDWQTLRVFVKCYDELHSVKISGLQIIIFKRSSAPSPPFYKELSYHPPSSRWHFVAHISFLNGFNQMAVIADAKWNRNCVLRRQSVSQSERDTQLSGFPSPGKRMCLRIIDTSQGL